MSEIRYGKSTLPECCLHLAARLGEPYAQAFRDVFEEMQENTGAGFSEVFCRHMEECLAALPVKKEDGENFLRFISKSSYADEGMQLRTMEMSRELLAGAIERVERENEEKCRLAVGLGAMSGMRGIMGVSLIFKIAAVGILVTILSQVLKHSGREEHAFLVSLAGLILVLTWIVPYIYDLFQTIQSLFSL